MKHAARVLLKGTFFTCLAIGLVFANVGKPAQAAEPIRIGTIMSITGAFRLYRHAAERGLERHD